MVIEQRLAVNNVLFFTFISVGLWIVPLCMPYWHVKRWFVALGLVGKMEMYMSLSGYELDLGCERYSGATGFGWLKKLCVKGQHGLDGYHTFQELQDYVCNLEEQTFRVVFRSCHDVQILTWTSLGCLFLIILSLLLLFVGGCFLWLYFNGHANPMLWNVSRGLMLTVPILQFCVLCLYAGMTGLQADFFDINALPDNPVTPNSPDTLTLNMSFFVAIFSMFASCSPIGISLFALERDPYLEYLAGYDSLTEEEAAMLMGVEYDPYGYKQADGGDDPYKMAQQQQYASGPGAGQFGADPYAQQGAYPGSVYHG